MKRIALLHAATSDDEKLLSKLVEESQSVAHMLMRCDEPAKDKATCMSFRRPVERRKACAAHLVLVFTQCNTDELHTSRSASCVIAHSRRAWLVAQPARTATTGAMRAVAEISDEPWLLSSATMVAMKVVVTSARTLLKTTISYRRSRITDAKVNKAPTAATYSVLKNPTNSTGRKSANTLMRRADAPTFTSA